MEIYYCIVHIPTKDFEVIGRDLKYSLPPVTAMNWKSFTEPALPRVFTSVQQVFLSFRLGITPSLFASLELCTSLANGSCLSCYVSRVWRSDLVYQTQVLLLSFVPNQGV